MTTDVKRPFSKDEFLRFYYQLISFQFFPCKKLEKRGALRSALTVLLRFFSIERKYKRIFVFIK